MSGGGGQPDYRALLQRAMQALDDMQRRVDASEERGHAPIAVIGMGCRFPGGGVDPDSYWDLLESGRDAVTEIPDGRWDVAAMFDPDPEAPGKSYTRWGGFLDDIDRFDPGFFGNAPREAVAMDPQHRLLLEMSWEAFEHAGIAPPTLAGSRAGVFVGMTGTDYSDLQLQAGDRGRLDAYFGTGISHSIAAGRLAYTYDLAGPAIAIDTACSSSLVATHLACAALRAGDCDLALGGGVNVMLSPDGHIMTSRARMMSFEGRCKTFDAAADGYVRAEGGALLVLKRLSDARRDGDRVLAVVRGTAINQDGRSNGLTAPNAAAQETVIRAALADGRLNPDDVDFVETHGTGTTLGDPIEIRALDAVFGGKRSRPLFVQSVKTNVGHLEAAAGIAGLCKLILSLQRGRLPQHLHLEEPNPYIPWDDVVTRVARGPQDWSVDGERARVGGISSFGFSGTNAHMVVEEAPPVEPVAPEAEGPAIYVVSGRTDAALDAALDRHAAALGALDPGDWPAAVATAATGRAHFEVRAAVVAADAPSAVASLEALRAGKTAPGAFRGAVPPGGAPEIAFLFTGQGAQHAGMGRGLYEADSTFRETLDRCDAFLREEAGLPLLDAMFASADDGRIDRTAFTQPALFSIELALAEWWRARGVEPAVVLGHSIGELAAACFAGVFSLEDGLRLVAERGRLMQALPEDGGMAAVFADETTVRAAIEPHRATLSIAALNGPGNVVVSGRQDSLDAVLAALDREGVRCTRLTVSHAFHSPSMDPMLDAFGRVVDGLQLAEPQIDLVANGTGATASAGELTATRYWREHVREAVRFEESVRTVVERGVRLFVEIGPQPTLCGMARRAAPDHDATWIPSLRKGRDDLRTLAEAQAALHVAGGALDWSRGLARRVIDLPRYPFQRERYWHELAYPAGDRPRRELEEVEDAWVGRPVVSPNLPGNVRERRLTPDRPAWLKDHCIFGRVVFPAAAYVELFLAAGAERFGDVELELSDLRIDAPLIVEEDAPPLLQTVVEDGESPTVEAFASVDGETWTRHAVARLHAADGAGGAPDAARALADVDDLRSDAATIAGADYYATLERMGVAFGPTFRRLIDVQRRDGRAVGRIAAIDGPADDRLHPAQLDAALQVIGLALPGAGQLDAGNRDVYLPVAAASVRSFARARGELVAVGQVTGPADGELVTARLDLFDAAHTCVARIEGLAFKRAARDALAEAGPVHDDAWMYETHWAPAPRAGAVPSAAGRRFAVWGVAPTAERVAAALTARGADVVRVADLEATNVDAWRERIATCASVDGWVLALEDVDGAAAIADRVTGPVAAAWTALAGAAESVSLSVVTAASAAAEPMDAPPIVPGAEAAAGLLRVARNERALPFCRRVDLGEGDAALSSLVDELLADDRDEPELALRADRRLALRLTRPDGSRRLVRPTDGHRLEVSEPGTFEGLALTPSPVRRPGPGEVSIRVAATGLNFRDVLMTLGRYPGEGDRLGSECAGEILEVGEGVADLRAGDRVMAVAADAFAHVATAPRTVVAKLPDHLSFAAGATVPIAFLTADWALNRLADLRQGETVLIHAGAGGVGMAAIQLARRAGARVFATAGSPTKRRRLEALGVEAVFDSRSLDFRPAVLERTEGRGVDVVLNSLAGDFIEAGVDCLAPEGRFLEIGMTDVWDDERFHAARPHAAYHVIFLGRECVERPDEVGARLRALAEDLDERVLQPLPYRAFALESAPDAFRFMAQARHVGKVVVRARPDLDLAPGAGYLVTGGLGGLGLAVAADWAARGARRLILAGRSAPDAATDEILRRIAADTGADVQTVQLDVSDAEQVDELVGALARSEAPLRGIVHAAGRLDDAPLEQLDRDRFLAVSAPKVDGAIHLAAAAESVALDHLVLFSAGAALFGAAGQANYAAANAVLDGIARSRRRAGYPVRSIAWGPWREAGMAARLGANALRRWESQGLGSLSSAEGTSALAAWLADGATHAAVLPIRWPSLLHHAGKHGLPPLLAELALGERRRQVERHGGDEASSLEQVLQGIAVERRREALTQRVRETVLRVLGLDPGQRVALDQGLTDLGMDSLMAVEVSNRLGVLVERSLPSTLAFEYPTLGELSGYLGELLETRVELDATATAETPAEPDAQPTPEEVDIDALTAEELEDALIRELETSGY